MNRNNLWNKRAEERFKIILRYARYMFNDHFLLVLLIALGGGAYYYKDWVETLDQSFPTAPLFAIVFTILLTYGTVITFFKEADKAFLLPLETEMSPYIVRSFIITVIWQMYWVLLVLFVLSPIYLNTMGVGILSLAALLIGLKIFNLWTRWCVEYDTDVQTLKIDRVIRLLINGFLIFLFLKQSYLLFGITCFIFLTYSLYFYKKAKGSGFHWERLIRNEERRMAFFYQLANLFTDVPHLKNQVKRRKWFDLFLPKQFSKQHTYTYLFARTFIRSGDYFGLFMRLTVIASFLIWGLSDSYIAFGIALLFTYLTGFQLLSLWKHYGAIIWTHIYPVADDIKLKSFLKLLLNILWTQNIIFTCIFSFW